MLDLLKTIHSPEDVKNLSIEQLDHLAKDIRTFLIQSLSQTGGHLASNLGVVELTIALHYVFQSPEDKFIWDVGHQSYVHKLLTGRRAGFKHLRQLDGMSGFPKRKESVHDVFETGHSSTSISAALGMAKARDLKGAQNEVVAIIGDGALTGGMAFEALNNAGRSNSNLIVILNDNEMSISKNVGGIGKYLNKLRSSKDYLRAKEDVEDVLHKIPVVGEHMVSTIKKAKEGVKSFVIENTLFEQLGFTYLGPVNGHDMLDLIQILQNAKEMKGPILIHIKTKKGKGYTIAEQKPSQFHGVGPFCISTGEGKAKAGTTNFSTAFGECVLRAADSDEKVVAITAAMPEGTGLLPFAKAYPKRFFDVGIAEEHAITFAAGLASEGYKPVAAIYSSFLQRAYDQVLHDVCLQNLPVIIGVDRAGLVGEDGPTHHGLYDIAFLSSMPNMTVLSPKMPEEIEGALEYAFAKNGPVAIRYPRGTTCISTEFLNDYKNIGFKTLNSGNNMAILATGRMVETALKVGTFLKEKGYEIAIIEAPCVWPINVEDIKALMKQYHYLFTLEDGIIQGGFGEKIFSQIALLEGKIKGKCFGHESGIVPHGKVEQLFEKEHLDAISIAKELLTILEKESR
ncbi:MAG: 1-deoxy-D-xylulose-5-phosphate synthase [Candidatus Cellulosilyticum pullistercoris]|uniref:1-deoxy-D-xylulose-5-phosphate synthase n=1 Tax=Candidatus Cellulosilyticum pullistercoris TaxID=2838521 RepID=A0A9E2NK14_9FIRM|nr:1-deoxy-D-xylulose-5-phosphate synthase [Candidatus Cellulosilyticum pullistercoris]